MHIALIVTVSLFPPFISIADTRSTGFVSGNKEI